MMNDKMRNRLTMLALMASMMGDNMPHKTIQQTREEAAKVHLRRIALCKERALIDKKQSNLSRRKRDAVVHDVEMEKERNNVIEREKTFEIKGYNGEIFIVCKGTGNVQIKKIVNYKNLKPIRE